MSETKPVPGLGHTGSDAKHSVENSRYAEQKDDMAGQAARGVCPFCPPDPVKNKPLFGDVFTHWHVWLNPYPYDFHATDFMIVPKRHITNAWEMSAEEGAELAFIYRHISLHLKDCEIAKRYDNPEEVSINYVMRSGPLKGTAGTIRHLHIQGCVTDETGPMFATFYKDEQGVMLGFIMFVGMLGLLKKFKPEHFPTFARDGGTYLATMARRTLKDLGIEAPKWWPKE